MNGLQYYVTSLFDRWRSEWQSARIARRIHPALLESVRRKIPDTSATDLKGYAEVRAAQLAQEHVDLIMQANPAQSGAFATRLLIKSTERAVKSVLDAIVIPRRTAA